MKNKKVLILIIIAIIAIISILGYSIIKKVNKENRKYEIEEISEYKYFVVREDGKYGIIDTKGSKIIETNYEDVKIPNPEKAVFICYEEETTKVLNERNEEIFTEYKDIEPLRLKNISTDLVYEKSILKYSEDGKYGIIDFNGKRITKAIYEEIDTLQYKEGELLVKEKGKYGIINIKGTVLVKAKYDKIESDKFYEVESGYQKSGYIVGQRTEEGYRYGYVNLDGKEIIESKYNDLYRILNIDSEEIYIICAENGKYGLIKNKEIVIENLYQALEYSETSNTIVAYKGIKRGVIAINGKNIIPCEYKQIDIIGENIYATDDDENVKIFNSKGERIELDKEESIVNVKDTNYKIHIKTTNGKTNYGIYINDKKVTKEEYTYIQYLFDNYFIACDLNGKIGIINENEKIIIPFNYNSIQKIDKTKMLQATNNALKTTEIYSHDMNKICELKNGTVEIKNGYIKLYNAEEIKYITEDEKEVRNMDIFKQNNIFTQKIGEKWGFVDKENKVIVEAQYENATELNKYGFAGIMRDNKWGVINSDGQVVVEPVYELNDNEPIFIGEYYQVVYGNGEIYYTK